ncbi:hypothetical protein F4779DRAFT_58641 [Xylariaceae sp. FL0662B]|nr:hypothetical protein F4779DRAFT_58641 [Xylariaceae sp. FL0662B]
MHSRNLLFFILLSSVTALPAVSPRIVTELDQTAFQEAQKTDSSARKALSGTKILTPDGRCLFVDELSGDFRANLTPIQVGECGATDGQDWDIITSGLHNNAADSMLIVSTLTNACFNFDPRRADGDQVILFSCGGRADGSGKVTDSQLFPFNGSVGPLMLSPRNDLRSCFTVRNNVIDVAPCVAENADQLFSFSSAPVGEDGSAVIDPTGSSEISALPNQKATSPHGTKITQRPTAISSAQSDNLATITATVTASLKGIANPTDAVPVSRAGGVLQPTSVSESQERDDTATRAFTSVSVRAPNGQCLFIDPTAGDFRQNLIPISLVDCAGTANEKFDIITAGKHNNVPDSALIVSSLTNGCLSFDGRRAVGDTVTIFSCGGRAAGEGETNNGQLVPFNGGTNLVLAPESEHNATCIVPGDGRLESAPCVDDGSQTFTILG